MKTRVGISFTLAMIVAVGVIGSVLTMVVLSARNAPVVHAATITVINTGDIGIGSFRQAILDANAGAGLDTIAFNIPAATDAGCDSGTGVCTILPASALPTIIDPVIIDGYTQPGSSPNTNGPGFGRILCS